MAKRAMRGSASQYTVFERTQTRVQQNAALKLSFNGECVEVELQTSRKPFRNHKTASQAFILNFMVQLQYVQSQTE